MNIVIENRVRRMLLAASGAFFVFAGGGAFGAAEKKAGPPPGVELLRIVEMVEPVYPLGLTIEGVVRGSVELVFGVDGEGRLDDYLITSYTHRAFAREVESVLKKWRFEPMRINGVPVWARAQLGFSFEARGVVITRYALDGVAMLTGSMLEEANRVQVVSRQADLDGPLVVAQAVSPLYPAQLADGGEAGVVMMEFFVDESGRVRLPVMEGNGAHPWFGEAAAQAVLQWRFEPPMRKGRPTVVRVRQQFVFSP